jgi:hypothetical protein
MRSPKTLAHEQLAALVAAIQAYLYHDLDRQGRDILNPRALKDGHAFTARDLTDALREMLREYGLEPARRVEHEELAALRARQAAEGARREQVLAALVEGLQALGAARKRDDLLDWVSDFLGGDDAAAVNRGGYRAQVAFLVSRYGLDEAASRLRHLLEDNG